jgi:hypothetical protein
MNISGKKRKRGKTPERDVEHSVGKRRKIHHAHPFFVKVDRKADVEEDVKPKPKVVIRLPPPPKRKPKKKKGSFTPGGSPENNTSPLGGVSGDDDDDDDDDDQSPLITKVGPGSWINRYTDFSTLPSRVNEGMISLMGNSGKSSFFFNRENFDFLRDYWIENAVPDRIKNAVVGKIVMRRKNFQNDITCFCSPEIVKSIHFNKYFKNRQISKEARFKANLKILYRIIPPSTEITKIVSVMLTDKVMNQFKGQACFDSFCSFIQPKYRSNRNATNFRIPLKYDYIDQYMCFTARTSVCPYLFQNIESEIQVKELLVTDRLLKRLDLLYVALHRKFFSLGEGVNRYELDIMLNVGFCSSKKIIMKLWEVLNKRPVNYKNESLTISITTQKVMYHVMGREKGAKVEKVKKGFSKIKKYFPCWMFINLKTVIT